MSQSTLVIVAHPNLSQSRVNRTWVEKISQFPDKITIHRLYETYPDGKIDIEAERKLLDSHQRIILQFPLFWFSAPSLLKHWLDTVITGDWALNPNSPKFVGKQIGIATSTGGPASAYQAGAINQFTISEYLRPFQGAALRLGASYLPPHLLQGVRLELNDETLAANAESYAQYVLA